MFILIKAKGSRKYPPSLPAPSIVVNIKKSG